MNNLNYNKFIQHVHSTSGLNESDESGESDYSNDTVIYEEDTTSLLNTSYNNLYNTYLKDDLEGDFVDVDLQLEIDTTEHVHVNKDSPVPTLKDRIINIHNRQKNIICNSLKCIIL